MSDLIPQAKNFIPSPENANGQGIPVMLIEGEGQFYVTGPMLIKVVRPKTAGDRLAEAHIENEIAKVEGSTAAVRLTTTEDEVEAAETRKGTGKRVSFLGGKATSGIVRAGGKIWKVIEKWFGGGGKE